MPLKRQSLDACLLDALKGGGGTAFLSLYIYKRQSLDACLLDALQEAELRASVERGSDAVST